MYFSLIYIHRYRHRHRQVDMKTCIQTCISLQKKLQKNICWTASSVFGVFLNSLNFPRDVANLRLLYFCRNVQLSLLNWFHTPHLLVCLADILEECIYRNYDVYVIRTSTSFFVVFFSVSVRCTNFLCYFIPLTWDPNCANTRSASYFFLVAYATPYLVVAESCCVKQISFK